MQTEIPTINIAKIATTESLSGLSTLQYLVGYEAGSTDRIYIRLSQNIDGNGKLNTTWKSLASIAELIPAEAEFTVSIFEPLYRGQSRNSHGFLAAALVAEGLVARLENRKYRRNDATEWSRELQALISAGTNLDVPAMEKYGGEKCEGEKPEGHSGSGTGQGKPGRKVKATTAELTPVR